MPGSHNEEHKVSKGPANSPITFLLIRMMGQDSLNLYMGVRADVVNQGPTVLVFYLAHFYSKHLTWREFSRWSTFLDSIGLKIIKVPLSLCLMPNVFEFTNWLYIYITYTLYYCYTRHCLWFTSMYFHLTAHSSTHWALRNTVFCTDHSIKHSGRQVCLHRLSCHSVSRQRQV